MATPCEQLEALRSLAENWDGYNAASPQADLFDLAQELVGLIEAMLTKRGDVDCALQVSPTRVGGILIEWETKIMEHEVEIDPDRSISFLHHDKSTSQIETRKLSPEQVVVQPGFLHELRRLMAA